MSNTGAVLITGAAKRIGRAIAQDMAARGWAVAVHYGSSEEEAVSLVEEINAGGGQAAAFRADLSRTHEVKALMRLAAGELGPLTCLVNNASVFEDDSLADVSEESWARHMDANLKAPVFLSQAFAHQLPGGAEGNIINIIDQRVWRLTPRFLSYTLSKAGLWTLTQTLAQALAPRIRVNGIGPGPTLKNERQDEADFARQQKSIPLGRGAQLQEIAAAVRFILESPSMTGQMIALDGGQHLAWETPDIVGIPE